MKKIFCSSHTRLAIINYLAIPALILVILVSHVRASKNDSGEFEEFGRRVVEALSAGDGGTFSEALDKDVERSGQAYITCCSRKRSILS